MTVASLSSPPVPTASRYPLIGEDDPPPFAHVNAEGAAPALLVADHAGRAFPKALGWLGLGDAALGRHVAYDIGVDWLTRRLAVLLDAPALIHRYSRLILDPNRPLDDPTSICAISDGVIVPGNRHLSAAEAEARADSFFHPYHNAIGAEIDGFLGRGVTPAFISVHSFTPEMRGFRRPWEIGVLWGDDGRMAVPLMTALEKDGVLVGDNEPYSGKHTHGHTVEEHALPRRLPNVLLEFRQDLVTNEEDAHRWADRIAGPLLDLLADPALTRPAA
ncbi:N-formylglutamate amidohydrolase [Inquilinus sp. CAU 1745]|uniref:N-formylglutamate amidohydrolase n=1 Tax=Inquilinus sp. CAU 1745 TaxID=3140369 RepID=UPI00325C3047